MEAPPQFDSLWSQYASDASPQLETLLRDLYESLVASTFDEARVQETTESVLSFLSSSEGRTDANCNAVNNFLLLGQFDYPELPNPIGDVLADMAGALHDTVSSPEIAENFDSTPEQLLARLRDKS